MADAARREGGSSRSLLDAIATSDGSRASVIEKMIAAKVTDSYLGSFEINENGDPSGAKGAVVGVIIYIATTKL